MIGCGHLGATHAACMAELGHEVLGVDIDPDKVALLRAGRAWFLEPDLDALLARHTKTGRLAFTTSFEEAARFGTVHFVGVGTPGLPDHSGYDLSQVFGAVAALAPHLTGPALIVGKSTVPPGTTARLVEELRRRAPAGDAVEVAWNPEFLREGRAVDDTLRPDRIVVGVPTLAAEATIREVYRPLTEAGIPLLDHRPGHRRAGQGGRQRVPGDQGVVHQRDGRRLREDRRRRRHAGRRGGHGREDRPRLPDRGHRLRRRLPAQGRPRPGRVRRRGRRGDGGRPARRGRRDQLRAPPARGRSRRDPPGRPVRQADRALGRGVQAGHRRRPRLPGPGRGRPAGPPRRAGRGLRSPGGGQRPGRLSAPGPGQQPAGGSPGRGRRARRHGLAAVRRGRPRRHRRGRGQSAHHRRLPGNLGRPVAGSGLERGRPVPDFQPSARRRLRRRPGSQPASPPGQSGRSPVAHRAR